MAVIDNYMDRYPEILRAIIADDHIDCLFNVLWINHSEELVEKYLEIYKELRGNNSMPIATWVYGPRLPLIHDMAGRMEDLGFPVFSNLETGIKALGIAYQYAVMKKERT